MADFKDTVKMFWFPMIINEYTAEFQCKKTSKDAKFKQCLYLKLPPPLLWAEPMRTMHFTASLRPGRIAWLREIHDKDSLMYNKQLLDEVYSDMKLINVEVRVISRAEGKDDNSYRNIDNFAYHKNRIHKLNSIIVLL